MKNEKYKLKYKNIYLNNAWLNFSKKPKMCKRKKKGEMILKCIKILGHNYSLGTLGSCLGLLHFG